MKRVAILGGGLVGSILYEYLRPFYKVALFRQSQQHNYTKRNHLESLISSYSFDVIINCCGFTGNPNVEQCETEKEACYKYNVEFPLMLSLVAKEFDIPVVHITTGCIYDNTLEPHEHVYTEQDAPNFGIYSDRSSYYSKCKHISQQNLLAIDNNVLLRIRIPFFSAPHRKNYITKLLEIDSLMDRNSQQTGFVNSKTCLDDLSLFVKELLKYDRDSLLQHQIYNVVNEQPLNTEQVLSILRYYNLENEKWHYVNYEDIPFKANRSNCILKNSFAELKLRTEQEALEQACKQIIGG